MKRRHHGSAYYDEPHFDSQLSSSHWILKLMSEDMTTNKELRTKKTVHIEDGIFDFG